MDGQPQGTVNTMDRAVEALEEHFSPEEEAEVQETEAQDSDGDSPDEVEVEETEEAEETEEEAEQEEEEQPAIESLEEVAEALDIPLEEFLASLKHKVKVDGEVLEVTLDELQAGYQKDRDYRQKTEAVKREREQFEQARSQAFEQLQHEHAQNAYILNTLEQQVSAQLNSEEMAQLKERNPQEYMLRRYEIQDRLQGFQQLKQEAAQRYQQLQQQTQQQQAEKLEKTLEKERELMHRAIPNWGQQTQQALNKYLTEDFGFSSEEVGQVYDHRLVAMAHKAMLYDQQASKVESTVKKVKKAPKLVKPTAQKPRVRSDDIKSLRGRLKKSGRVEDAAKLIESGIL